MCLIVGLTVVVIIVISSVLWFRTLRAADQIDLLLNLCFKIGIQRFVLRRPILHNLSLSNGRKLLMPRAFLKYSIDEVLKLDIRHDDVFVSSYMKAGTTWVSEIVWLICNDADTVAAKQSSVNHRFVYVEALDHQGFGCGLQSIEKLPKERRRYIKTHLPFELLPNELQRAGKGKMIYVARNPKDLCVSLYHFYKMVVTGLPEPGTWSEFLGNFCRSNVAYGSWFGHVEKYWQVYQERKDTMYFVTYENLKKNLKEEVKKLADFLEKDLSDEKVDSIVHHCTFANLSVNQTANHSETDASGIMDFKISKFMRKGQVGDWKNYFTINQNQEFDRLFRERTKDWTLKFEFEPVN